MEPFSIKKSRYTDSQILSILKKDEASTAAIDLCREYGIRRMITILNTMVKIALCGMRN